MQFYVCSLRSFNRPATRWWEDNDLRRHESTPWRWVHPTLRYCPVAALMVKWCICIDIGKIICMCSQVILNTYTYKCVCIIMYIYIYWRYMYMYVHIYIYIYMYRTYTYYVQSYMLSICTCRMCMYQQLSMSDPLKKSSCTIVYETLRVRGALGTRRASGSLFLRFQNSNSRHYESICHKQCWHDLYGANICNFHPFSSIQQ